MIPRRLGAKPLHVLRTLAMVLLCLIAPACQQSDPEGVPTAAPSPSPATPEAYYGGGDPCPDIKDGIGCRSSASGDFDGDGEADELRVEAVTGDDGFPSSWRLFATFASGRDVEARGGWWTEQSVGAPPESADWWIGYPAAVAAFDVDGDGRDEGFVKIVEHVLHGGSVPDHSLFRVKGGRLKPLEDENGNRFEFVVGGLPSYGGGLRCRDRVGDEARELITVRVENAVYPTPRWKRSVYVFRGDRLFRVGRSTGTMKRQGFPDPKIDAFYKLRCDGVSL